MQLHKDNGVEYDLAADTPYIYNKALTTHDTEYSQALPARCKRFTLQCRDSTDLKLAFTVGESGTKYITIKAGSAYTEDMLDSHSAVTLYIQCAADTKVAEIIAWV
jgi:hypothetical protein